MVGSALQPGFQPRPGEPLSPCLDHPIGLDFTKGALHIADTGNRALRIFPLDRGELWTVAEGPTAPLGMTYGLCRDNLPFLPEKGYAGLDAPRAFLSGFPVRSSLFALCGRCITHLPLGWTETATPEDTFFKLRMDTEERDLQLVAD